MWIGTAERSRRIDWIAREERGLSTAVLMERAGESVLETVEEFVGPHSRVAVLCGRGNNGGDGLVVARLAHRDDYKVQCLIACPRGDLGMDAEARHREAEAAGVSIVFSDDPLWRQALSNLSHADVIVDALLGTGARGEVHGVLREAVEAANASGVPIVAVDIPSGIDCDTGEILGCAVKAVRTVTFGLPKPFLFQGHGIEHAGKWTVADIGFPEDLLTEPTEAMTLSAEWVGNRLPRRPKTSHKGANGSLLVVAGSWRYPGAAALVALGAVRAGCGLVTVAAIPSVCAVVAAHVPEAVYLPLPEIDGAEQILSERDRHDAAVFGPGATTESDAMDLFRKVWEAWSRPCVVDADGLNAAAKGVRFPLGPLALTPHPGEAARLLGWDALDVNRRRFEAVEQIAKKFGASALLKGAATVVASNGDPLAVNTTGNPGMAAAGMGDVLAGIVGALLAQGLDPGSALAAAAYWHGLAGDLCAEHIGQVGYSASDLAAFLPAARDKILQECEVS